MGIATSLFLEDRLHRTACGTISFAISSTIVAIGLLVEPFRAPFHRGSSPSDRLRNHFVRHFSRIVAIGPPCGAISHACGVISTCHFVARSCVTIGAAMRIAIS